MPLSLLRSFDRWAGWVLLFCLALPSRLLARLLPAHRVAHPRHVFLKLKGGGSLIIALPALLGLRQLHPDAEFTIVCTRDTQVYAALTGLFDRYILIDDRTLPRLILTGLRALLLGFRAACCIDLEPNSLLTAVFTQASCATRRAGPVRADRRYRAWAYTDPVPADPAAPLYDFHDALAARLGAASASVAECAALLRRQLPALAAAKGGIGLSPFTSDFARERMMAPEVWRDLLAQEPPVAGVSFVIFGAARDRPAAERLAVLLRAALPDRTVALCCGSSFGEAIATLAGCGEFWSVDTGLLHVARLLGIPCRSFWGPTRPDQRLRPIAGLREEARFRPFQCAPCLQGHERPPCRGDNLCMQTMAQSAPDLRPPWVQRA